MVVAWVTVAEMEAGKASFCNPPKMGCGDASMMTRPLEEKQVKKFNQQIGKLVVGYNVLREVLKPYSLARKMSDT